MFAVREVSGACEDLEPASRDGRMGRATLLDRDDAVVVAPDDQRRNFGREVEPVGRAHALAGDIDDRSQRVQERGAGFGVAQRPVAVPRLREVRAAVNAVLDLADAAAEALARR